ncbi:GNAT family N-acetyltransferase [Alteromonas sp. CYL-A6]|uniref:GNAT family N-acetyltransferase n=1 Tax=Alteromonas nitratireducens TaxID=3390813 RepID=UPI0034BC01DB
MIDLSVLPSRLPPVLHNGQQVAIQRLAPKHTDLLCEAGQRAAPYVKPWMGAELCPVTPAAAKQSIATSEASRQAGFGITYVLIDENRCLGMGLINYIHPTHLTANLGFWIRPEACGQGLAVKLARSLMKLGFAQMGLHRLECLIEPANKASLRVIQRIGGQQEGLCRKRLFGKDALLYSLTAD